MLRKIFPFLLVGTGVFLILVYFTSLFSISELVYPDRITSVSVLENEKEKTDIRKDTLSLNDLMMDPAQLGLSYVDFNVTVDSNFRLKGWYVKQQDAVTAKTILLLHDLNESKISLLQSANVLYQLGFNICLVDLPAHGESDGDKFLINEVSAGYISTVLDSLYCLLETNRVAIYATGISGFLAVKCLVNDRRADVLVLQNPPNTFNKLLRQRVKEKWGVFAAWVYPLAKLKYKKSAEIEPDSLNLSEWVKRLKKPVLIALTDSVTDDQAKDALHVFENIESGKSKIWTSQSRSFITNDVDVENNMYRAVAAFINTNATDKTRKVKSKKRIAKI